MKLLKLMGYYLYACIILTILGLPFSIVLYSLNVISCSLLEILVAFGAIVGLGAGVMLGFLVLFTSSEEEVE
jgi:hypothetical protein